MVDSAGTDQIRHNESREIMEYWVSGLPPDPVKIAKGEAVMKDMEKKAELKATLELNKVGDALIDPLRKSRQLHWVLMYVNIIMIAIGIVLLIIAIYLALIQGEINTATLTFAGIGSGQTITILLINPQDRMKKSMSQYMKYTLIGNGWSNRTQVAINAYINSSRSKDDTKTYDDSTKAITDDALRQLNDYVDEKPSSEDKISAQKSQDGSGRN